MTFSPRRVLSRSKGVVLSPPLGAGLQQTVTR
jgi:hypothetical protein